MKQFFSRYAKSIAMLSTIFCLCTTVVQAQIIKTIAGGGVGDGGTATSASLNYPRGVAVDASGNIYIADQYNNRIRKVNSSGIISTIAGNGTNGFSGDGGAATSASLNYPSGVAVDASGNIYIADSSNNRIRKVNTSGIISTIAGNGIYGYSGDGGAATSARFRDPTSVAVDASGNIYIVDAGNNRIRKVNSSGIIRTIAGNGTNFFSGDGGAATSASLDAPTGVAVDASGNIYIADTYNYRIRKVNSSGIISTIAGNGTQGFSGDGGAATSAWLYNPTGVSVDASGNIYIADYNNQRIRKVNSSGIISTIAGNGTYGFSDDGGAATSASLNQPSGVSVDASGNIYIAEQYNNRIRKVNSSGIISTVAGNGSTTFSGDGGAATSASLNGPSGVAVDASGNIYIADQGNNRIREVVFAVSVAPTISSFTPATAATGTTVTIKGTGFTGVSAVSFGGVAASSYAFVNDSTVTAVVGAGASGSVSVTTSGGVGSLAGFSYCTAVTPSISITSSATSITTVTSVTFTATPVNGGTAPTYQWQKNGVNISGATTDTYTTSTLLNSDSIWVILSSNAACATVTTATSNKVHMYVSDAIIKTIAGNGTSSFSGEGGAATSAGLMSPSSIARDNSGNIYILDGNRIRKVNQNGVIITVAGNGINGYTGDGGLATSASLNALCITVDNAGNIYLADNSNNVIRKVNSSGIISTIAGNGTASFSGDGGAATSASLNKPEGVAVDAFGNIYIADFYNNRIRKVSTSGVISTVAGNGTQGFSGDGGQATSASLYYPSALAIDSSGNIYVEDRGRIRKINTSGIINTLAGNGNLGEFGDGDYATNAILYNPSALAIDGIGNIYFVEPYTSIIRKINTSGIINTIAGKGAQNFGGDGGAATSASLKFPSGVAVDASGNIYIADLNNNRIREVVFAVAPTISSFTPVTAATGTTVTIKGAGFTGVSAVSFGGVAASSYAFVNDSTVTAVVGIGASGSVSVRTGVGTTSLGGFTFIYPNFAWLGTNNSNWQDAANWSYNTFPTNLDTAIIFSNTPFNANIPNNSTITIGGLVLKAGSVVVDSGILNIKGKLTNNGAITGTGVVNLTGTSTQNIDGTGSISNLTINGAGATIASGMQNITGILTPQAGTLNTNGYLTLKSTSIANTAMVSKVSGSVVGNVTVERFIPQGVKAFRSLCTGGVYNTGSIYNNWQEGGNNSNNYGIFITGKSGTVAGIDPTTGLDITPAGYNSVYNYTNYLTYTPVTNTYNTNLDPYTGYLALVYGNRSLPLIPSSVFDSYTNMHSDAIIRSTGSLVTGTVTYSPTGVTGNYNSSVTKILAGRDTGTFIANPYACAVSWSSLAKTGLTSSYYYYEPTYLTGGYQSFVSYNPIAGTNSNPTKSNINNYIQPGQGFWIQTNSTVTTNRKLVFTENDKVTNQPLTAVFGTGAAGINRIPISLWSNGENLDGAVAVFNNNFTNSIGDEDSKKIFSGGASIVINENNHLLSIDGLANPIVNDVIAIQLFGLTVGKNYHVRLDANEFTANGLTAYLQDAKTNTQTAIGADSTVYSFTATTASDNRFSIVFKKTAPLFISSIHVKAQPKGEDVLVNWTVTEETKVAAYEVQTSKDGKEFTTATSVKANNSGSISNYNWLDTKAQTGTNYYRIKTIGANGEVSYSEIVKVVINKDKSMIAIYPNPVTSNSVSLQMTHLTKGNYQAQFINTLGQTVFTKTIEHAGGNATVTIALNSSFANGTYHVQLKDGNGQVYVTELVINK